MIDRDDAAFSGPAPIKLAGLEFFRNDPEEPATANEIDNYAYWLIEHFPIRTDSVLEQVALMGKAITVDETFEALASIELQSRIDTQANWHS